jgi:hypothetical protein
MWIVFILAPTPDWLGLLDTPNCQTAATGGKNVEFDDR